MPHIFHSPISYTYCMLEAEAFDWKSKKEEIAMSLYPYILLLHIVGVLGLFIATGLEITILFRMRSAKHVGQVREWTNASRPLELVIPLSALLILAAGLTMTFMGWGWSQAWISISLLAFLTMAVMGGTINTRRIKAIHSSAEKASDGPIATVLRRKIADRVLWTSALAMGFTDLGIVGLMVIKPGWIASIATLIVAAAIGTIMAQLALRNAPTFAKQEATPAVLEEAGVR